MRINKIFGLLVCFFVICLFPESGLSNECPEVLSSLIRRPVSKEVFIRGFKKEGLTVNLFQESIRLAELQIKYGEKKGQQVWDQLKATRVFRDMEIVNGIRGRATVVTITLKDAHGIVLLTRNAKGDPRTPEGKLNIKNNTTSAIAELRNRLIEKFASLSSDL